MPLSAVCISEFPLLPQSLSVFESKLSTLCRMKCIIMFGFFLGSFKFSLAFLIDTPTVFWIVFSSFITLTFVIHLSNLEIFVDSFMLLFFCCLRCFHYTCWFLSPTCSWQRFVMGCISVFCCTVLLRECGCAECKSKLFPAHIISSHVIISPFLTPVLYRH